ncbi:FG-GAP-like repeat-containing protein [Hyalangium rubrum]|uniref:FG-GAP-like repeat-containing protein n=1 Tax=Hyalangium rubrum TaxID=3103134 RepID=A0ABU5H8G9_9BACT|nr:FG-GAP-like repeat-containing protein [Hyalangium sp. s54d21]MDY7229605.1 FG-GAP-like repeat-containing protein [Hyalangium sp. s54d21]
MSLKKLKAVPGTTWMAMAGLLLTACNPEAGQPETRPAWSDPESAWVSADAPVREGYIWNGARERFEAVRYADVDGMAVLEGDILLGSVEQVEALTREVQAQGGPQSQGVRAQGVAISGAFYRWPDAVVPYTINPNLPSQNRVTDAIAHWQSKTQLRFVLRTASNAAIYPNYVTFQPGDGCNSWVGMQGGQQAINLAANCSTGSTIHEIGHAIGLWHEQSREDRDAHVRIRWENIQAGYAHNFDKQVSNGEDVFGYDFDSIMHYGAYAFSANGQPTLETLGGQSIGQRNGLSNTDVNASIKLYSRQILVNEAIPHFQSWAAETRAVVTGDFNGDGRTDIAAVGAGGWSNLPVALSNGNGSFRLVNEGIPYFQSWAAETRTVVTGDFNGDGRTDIAAVGAGGWSGLPVALSNGNGSFRLVNEGIPYFQSWAAETRTVVTGDFNGDGWTDIAAVGAGGWSGLPVALSNGNGSFRLVNEGIPYFQSWAAETRTVVTGDFNGDGRTDIAAVGAGGWSGLPVALSNGNGSFRLVNEGIPYFQSWAAETRTVVTGDFNGDGRTDLAAVGANGWSGLPVALSNGNGSFQLVNEGIPHFQTQAAATRTVVTGDFNGDGRTDIAAVGADGWGALPMAISNGNGSFRSPNEYIPYFQSWASATRTVVTGDFNGDGRTDLAAVGAGGWAAVPVALIY